MKQISRSLRSGSVNVATVPAPGAAPGQVLVQVASSLISSGTERTALEFSSKGLLAKAKARPDLAKTVVAKARKEGVLTAIDSVRSRLDQPLPLGYSAAGTVLALGQGVETFQVGDLVACAGASHAYHAEAISVPQNLAAKLPEGVGFEEGAFATVGAIAVQGLRLAEVQFGEAVVVIGLGLVGLLTAQIAQAAGCRVFGLDPSTERCALAESLGCEVALPDAGQLDGHLQQATGFGADKVVICAATPSNEPVTVAGRIARDKAIVVAVGLVGTEVPRGVYYDKELTFRVSRSYGPGRYDSSYEEKGNDYPIGYVRWTENRNMQAFLQLVAEKKVDVKAMVSHRFSIEQGEEAFDLVAGKASEPSLAVLLTYPDQPQLDRRVDLTAQTTTAPSKGVALGLLGAGNFATSTLLPAMKGVQGLRLVGVAAGGGLSARHAGDRFGFQFCTTDELEIINNADINSVALATRHDLHSRQVVLALEAGKHTYCEKPLCLDKEQLADIIRAARKQPDSILTVGFNRRFSPMAKEMKTFLDTGKAPLLMHYRVNAGFIDGDHWVQDPDQGGGRIIGEVCHFVDFLTYLAGALPVLVTAHGLPNSGRYHDDNVAATLTFSDGSTGVVTYAANGDASSSKERLEVFGGGASVVLDGFRKLEMSRSGHQESRKARLRQEKGHSEAVEAFASAVVQGSPPPIPFLELVATTLTTFAIVEALQTGQPVAVDAEGFIAAVVQGDNAHTGEGG